MFSIGKYNNVWVFCIVLFFSLLFDQSEHGFQRKLQVTHTPLRRQPFVTSFRRDVSMRFYKRLVLNVAFTVTIIISLSSFCCDMPISPFVFLKFRLQNDYIEAVVLFVTRHPPYDPLLWPLCSFLQRDRRTIVLNRKYLVS